MGIESDQLVYDYLSRVGDLAQATTLTAAERARLVTGLRQAIDDRRGGSQGGSQRTEKAVVQKILSGIGTPADVVRQAVHNGVPESAAPAAPTGATARTRGRADAPSVPVQASAPPGGSGPGLDSGSGSGPGDWWRSAGGDGADGGFDEGGMSPLIGAALGELPGWRAVYEADFLDPEADPRAARIPEQRRSATDALPGADGAELPEEGAPGQADDPAATARPRRLRLRRPAPVPDEPVEVVQAPRSRLPLVETLAAVVLAAAAVLGLWYIALLGWFFAYSSRRLGQRVARIAGVWLPLWAAVVCGTVLYTRVHGQHGGQPETSAAFQSALHTAVGLWLRAASGCSAAFLAWQISRRR